MSTQEAPDLDDVDVLHKSLEQDNRSTASQQVEKINSSLRKMRKLSRVSQRQLRAVADETTSTVEESTNPNLVDTIELNSFPADRAVRDYSTGEFLIPEPDAGKGLFADMLSAATQIVRREKASMKPLSQRGKVVHRWKIL
tara:strand:+ start:183708 stop:184130 length:423 start_codon:yes stop_codon:yes gene_type:complete